MNYKKKKIYVILYVGRARDNGDRIRQNVVAACYLILDHERLLPSYSTGLTSRLVVTTSKSAISDNIIPPSSTSPPAP